MILSLHFERFTSKWEDNHAVIKLGWREVHGLLKKTASSWILSSKMGYSVGEQSPSLQVSSLQSLTTENIKNHIHSHTQTCMCILIVLYIFLFAYLLICGVEGLLRCGKSCRLRWINYLRPDLKRGMLSEMEENQIIQLHARLGNRSLSLATSSKHLFPRLYIVLKLQNLNNLVLSSCIEEI